MLFSVLALAVAADDGQLKLSRPGRITAGSTFTLTMKLAGIDTAIVGQGIIGLSFSVKFDSEVISVVDGSLGGKGFDLWDKGEGHPVDPTTKLTVDDAYSVMIADAEDKAPIYNLDDLVVTLDFNVPASAAGQDVIIEAQDVSIVYGKALETLDLTSVPVDFTVARKSDVSATVDGITYLVDDETASVVSVANKSVSDLVIPASIVYNGKTLKVTSVEGGAFADLSAIKTAYIPCTVTSVPTDAFDGNAAVTLKGCKNSGAYKFAIEQGFEWEEDTAGYTEKVIRESTCTTQGASQLTCPDCGTKTGSEKALPLADHKYGDWVVTKEATNDEDGSRERTCTVCGTKDTEVIHKLDCKHENKKDAVVKEATCTESGSKNVVCADCGKVLEENIEIPKTAHTFGDWVVTKEATVKDKGTREHTCTVCGAKETEETDKLTCSHANTANGHKDPTCTADGYDSTTCKDCGKLISYTKIAAKHTAGPEETKDATCTADGYVIQKCTACGEILKNEVTPKLGHEFGEWQVIVPATTTSEGVQSHTCSRCGQIENQMIEKLAPTEESKEESVPAIESSDAEDSRATVVSKGDETSGSGNKTIFFIIGAVVILLTVGYIVIMAINKKKNY